LCVRTRHAGRTLIHRHRRAARNARLGADARGLPDVDLHEPVGRAWARVRTRAHRCLDEPRRRLAVRASLRPGKAAVTEPLLEISRLRIEARGAHEPRTIVGGMSLRLAAGETVGIVGESGSGKSMTARAVLGLLPPGLEATGAVSYGGREILGLPERQLRQVRGGEI